MHICASKWLLCFLLFRFTWRPQCAMYAFCISEIDKAIWYCQSQLFHPIKMLETWQTSVQTKKKRQKIDCHVNNYKHVLNVHGDNGPQFHISYCNVNDWWRTFVMVFMRQKYACVFRMHVEYRNDAHTANGVPLCTIQNNWKIKQNNVEWENKMVNRSV